jgi:hypothetical protein
MAEDLHWGLLDYNGGLSLLYLPDYAFSQAREQKIIKYYIILIER